MTAVGIGPKQTLFLWHLLVEPDGVFLDKTFKPDLKPAERNQLVADGLIVVEKKRKDKPKSRPSNYAILTEKGWHWAETHLDAKLPKQGNAALRVLEKLLARLKPRIEAGELTLAAILAPEPNAAPESASRPAATDDVRSRVRNACLHLSGDGRYGVRIRLSDLRARLANVPRQELDQALMDLERSEEAALYPLDDPREIVPADEEAALPNSSGNPRHILYLSSPR